MAIQTHLYHENLGLLPLSSSQDYFFMENNNNNNNNIMNNNNNNNNNNMNSSLLFNEQLLQQQQQQLQYQQQYVMNLQNTQKRNNGFMLLPPLKKQKIVNNATATTTTTTTATTGSTTTIESVGHGTMNLSQSLCLELEKQRNEIDRFITLQNERLKWALHEQRKQQYGTIIKKIEARAQQLLRQKDEQIAQATKKSMEFQEMVRKLEVENQAWQRVALENEALVTSLNNTLEQLKQHSSSSSNNVDDRESCCNIPNDNDNDDNNNNNIVMAKIEPFVVEQAGENRATTTTTNACKVCKSRNSCMLMLPCRHLCCCIDCETILEACPVCKSSKMSSFQVFMS